MKVGIITWYKYENYGTKLQAIALQEFLKNNNYDVDLLDFDVIDFSIDERSLKQKIKDKYWYKLSHLNNIIYKREKEEKRNKLKKIIEENVNISTKIKSDKDFIKICNSYDVIICGSDQIWNPNWYHPYYFANFEEIKTKLIAYAPSFGIENIDKSFPKYEELKLAINRFDSIAVREIDGQKIIKKLTGKEVQLVVDPTLLLTKENWEKYESKRTDYQDYIAYYMLSNNKTHYKSVLHFSKKHNLKLVTIPSNGLTSCIHNNNVRNAGCEEFLSIIKNAKYVITDSFHATIFSLIYNKEFYLLTRHNPNSKHAQNSRLKSLLNSVNLSNRLLDYNIKKIPNLESINYHDVNIKLSKMIKESQYFLLESIKKKESQSEK